MFEDLLAITTGFFAWYNAVFIACFAIGVFFTVLQVMGLGQTDADVDAGVEADADVDADVDADIDADVDADVDTDADADVDADADADADAEAEADAHAAGVADSSASLGAMHAMAQFVGVGRVPISAILMTLFYTVGIAGWISNGVLAERFESDRALFATSLPIALVVGVVLMRIASSVLGRYMPAVLTSAMSRRKLVGLSGEAVLPVGAKFGRARVRDRYGTQHQLSCKVPPGVSPIAKGERILLTKYLPGEDMFYVCRARS